MTIQWHVGDVVRKLREHAGKTQEEVAAAAGVRPATISRIENTARHDPETLRAIAEALKTTVAEIHILVEKSNSSGEPAARVCRDNDPAHISYHELIEAILHGEVATEELAQITQDGLQALVRGASSHPAPKGKKFSVFNGPPRPGDKVVRKERVVKRRRK